MGLQKESTSSSKAASADGSGTSSLSGPDSSRNGGYDDDLVTEHGNADAGEEDGEDPKPTFAEYWRVLSRNEYFRLFFISYCIDNVGNWLNFIACLSIMDQFGKSYYTAVYLSLRLLPPLLLAGTCTPYAYSLLPSLKLYAHYFCRRCGSVGRPPQQAELDDDLRCGFGPLRQSPPPPIPQVHSALRGLGVCDIAVHFRCVVQSSASKHDSSHRQTARPSDRHHPGK